MPSENGVSQARFCTEDAIERRFSKQKAVPLLLILFGLLLTVGFLPKQALAEVTVDPGAPRGNGALLYDFPDLTISAATDGDIKTVTMTFDNWRSGDRVYLVDGYANKSSWQAGGFKYIPNSLNANATVLIVAEEGATNAQWQTMLREVLRVQLGSPSEPQTLKFMVSNIYQKGSAVYNPNNHHYYEYIKMGDSGGLSSWSSVYNAIRNNREVGGRYNYMGMPGYLATITSQEEHDFLYGIMNPKAYAWIAGTCDYGYTLAAVQRKNGTSTASRIANAESLTGQVISNTNPNASWTFYWVDGPEEGLSFATPNSPKPHTTDVNIRYSNWCAGEPNNYGSGERFAHFYTEGKWNDYPDNSSVAGFFVEYGGESGTKWAGTSGSASVPIETKEVDVVVDPRKTIKLHKNFGDNPEETFVDKQVTQGATESFTYPTREGWYCIGFSTHSELKNADPGYYRTSIGSQIRVDHDLDLYCIWRKDQFEEYVHDYYHSWDVLHGGWTDMANLYLSNVDVGVTKRIDGTCGFDGTAATKDHDYTGSDANDVPAYDAELAQQYGKNDPTKSWVTRPFADATLYGWSYTKDGVSVSLPLDDSTLKATDAYPFELNGDHTEYRGRLDLFPVWETYPELYKSVVNRSAVDESRSVNQPGDSLDYTITAKNQVRGSAWRSVTVSDALPGGIDPQLNAEGGIDCTVVRNSGEPVPVVGTYDADSRTITIADAVGTLKFNDVVTVSFSAIINDAYNTELGTDDDANRALITNVATATGTDTVGDKVKEATSNAAIPQTALEGESGGGEPGGPGVLPEGDNGSSPWVSKSVEGTEADGWWAGDGSGAHPEVYRNISYVTGVHDIGRLDTQDEEGVVTKGTDTVTITDRIPMYTVFDSNVVPRVYAGDTLLDEGAYTFDTSGRKVKLEVNRSAMGGATSLELHFSVTVSSYAGVGERIVNRATINLIKDDAIVATGGASATTTEVVDSGSVDITKHASNLSARDRAAAGTGEEHENLVHDRLMYSVTLTNNKVYGWKGVVFYDVIPKGLTYIPGTLQIQKVEQEGLDYTDLPDDAFDASKRTITICAGDLPGLDGAWQGKAPSERYSANYPAQRQIVLRYEVELNNLAVARTTHNIAWAQGGILPFEGLNDANSYDIDKWSHHEGEIGSKAELADGFVMGRDNDAEKLSDAVKAECPLPFTESGEGVDVVNPKDDYLFVIDPADRLAVARLYTDNALYESEGALDELVGRHINRLTGLSEGPAEEAFPDEFWVSASGKGWLALPHNIDSAYDWAEKVRGTEGGGGKPGEDYTFVGWTFNPIASWNPYGTNRIIADSETISAGVTRIYPVYVGKALKPDPGSGEEGGEQPDGKVTKTAALDPNEQTVPDWIAGTYYENCPLMGNTINYTLTASPALDEGATYDRFIVSDMLPAHTTLKEDSVFVQLPGQEGPTPLTRSEDGGYSNGTYVYNEHSRTISYIYEYDAASPGNKDTEVPTFGFAVTIDSCAANVHRWIDNQGTISFVKKPSETDNGATVASGLSNIVTIGPVADQGDRSIKKAADNLTATEQGRAYSKAGDRVRYTITAYNNRRFELWNNVVVYDRIPEALTIDPATIVLRDAQGNEHGGLEACYNAETRELCLYAGDVPAAGPDLSATDNSVQVTFEAVIGDLKGVAGGASSGALWNRAQAIDGVDAAICDPGSTPGMPAALAEGMTIGDYKERYSVSWDYVESAAALPFIEEDGSVGPGGDSGGGGGADPGEAILLACWREKLTDSTGATISDSGPGYPHLAYFMPNVVVWEQIIGRTPVVASVEGGGSLSAYVPTVGTLGTASVDNAPSDGQADPDARPEAELNLITGVVDEVATIATQAIGMMSADAWAQTVQSAGGPMPDDTDDWVWIWRGWTDDPRTSWNPYGTDRILGANDLVIPLDTVNRVYPVYARVAASSVPPDEEGEPIKDGYELDGFSMEKGLVTPVEKVTIYQELEYKVAAHNIADAASWENVTFMDKFPAYATLVPGSVYLKVVDYNGVDTSSGQDGRILAEYQLEQSSDGNIGTFEPNKYNYDASRSLISYRILRDWLEDNPISIGSGQSCELRFKICVTRECFQEIQRLGSPKNDGCVTWAGPADPSDPDTYYPLWTGEQTVPMPEPQESEGTRGITKEAENLTRGSETARIGDRVKYTITATNGKSYSWEGVRILDVLPEGLTIDPASIRIVDTAGAEHVVSPSAYVEETRRLCVAAGDIGAGESVVLTFEAVIDESAAGQGADIGNKAYAGGYDPYDPNNPYGSGGGSSDSQPIGSPASWPDGWELLGESDGTGNGTGIGSGTCYPIGTEGGPVSWPDPDPQPKRELVNITEPNNPDVMTKNAVVESGPLYKEVLHYSVTLTNPMPGPAWENMEIFDYLPKEVVYLEGSLTLTKPDGTVESLPDTYFDAESRVFDVPVGSIAQGETFVMEYKVGVPDDVEPEKPIVNKAKANVPAEVQKKAPSKTAAIPHAKKSALARTADSAPAMLLAVAGLAAVSTVTIGAILLRRRRA